MCNDEQRKKIFIGYNGDSGKRPFSISERIIKFNVPITDFVAKKIVPFSSILFQFVHIVSSTIRLHRKRYFPTLTKIYDRIFCFFFHLAPTNEKQSDNEYKCNVDVFDSNISFSRFSRPQGKTKGLAAGYTMFFLLRKYEKEKNCLEMCF